MSTLFVIAHQGEAQVFIKRLQLVRSGDTQDLFSNQDKSIYLLLCGEGEAEAMTKTSFYLGKLPEIKKVINTGIAGSLSKKHGVGEILKIRSSYSQLDDRSPKFHSFSSKEGGTADCISSLQRVITKNSADSLELFASVVDRELWGIAKACKLAKVPWISIKLISDLAGQNTDCFDLKNRAQEFSQKLYDYYHSEFEINENIDVASFEEEVIQLPEFHFTAVQRADWKKLTNLLLRKSRSKNKLLKELVDNFKNQEKRPKDRTRDLLLALRSEVNPYTEKISQDIKAMSKNRNFELVEVFIDPSLEDESVQIKVKLKNKEDISTLTEDLKKIPFATLEKVFAGEVDV
ncbi:MAG: hypothetical protein AB8E15_04185 [Bdellovibrionales bacterium]